eukprot:Em0002g1385a
MPPTSSQAPLTSKGTQNILSHRSTKPLVCENSNSDWYTRLLPESKQPQSNPSKPLKNDNTVRSDCPPVTHEGEYIELVCSSCPPMTQEETYAEIIDSKLPPPSPPIGRQVKRPTSTSKLPDHSCTKHAITGTRAYLHRLQQEGGEIGLTHHADGFAPSKSTRACLTKTVSAPPSVNDSDPSTVFDVPDNLRKDRLSRSKAPLNLPFVRAPSCFETATHLLNAYDAVPSGDSDSDSDGYVIPDNEFHPDWRQQENANVGKRAHANGSEEETGGLFPTLGVVRHVAEERCRDAHCDRQRAHGCKNSRR